MNYQVFNWNVLLDVVSFGADGAEPGVAGGGIARRR
jgi:hypothetical protein